ncbi:hypothetical protein A3C86_04315 [Candidatus Kaiserbacteria bacterium RIFCSPHIGHO2_02_FULL_49_16]|uniref:Uncharacterized protein n=1 Tax=Candidatus Kaiserbacteria bacterium RIFCSPHIGHO2_02_FULL_49_16 TaxID=1798490 RepID=A0A1F6DAD4_9BACT|nr:MAG: hypothetical protein A3C86_04315 [Candidatus Kaiserbacteria bacterium RIFCSPHIGHO2_02_FULL_49_16]
MDTMLLALSDTGLALTLVFSAFIAWLSAYLISDFLGDAATKRGREYIAKEFSRAEDPGAAVIAGLILLVLVLSALELESWVRGRASVFVGFFLLTSAICGWRSLRSNDVPFGVLLAGVVVSVCATGFWYLLAESGYAHPIAATIQALILIALNPFAVFWVHRQYRSRR